MPKRFYLDTAIWRDYFEDRKDGMKPLGEFAFQFLKDCQKKGFEIIVSDVVILELEAHLPKERIKAVFSFFKDIIMEVSATPEHVFGARKEWQKRDRRLPFKDVLHAVIAKDNKALLVARDHHFFDFLTGIVEVEKPEDIRLV